MITVIEIWSNVVRFAYYVRLRVDQILSVVIQTVWNFASLKNCNSSSSFWSFSDPWSPWIVARISNRNDGQDFPHKYCSILDFKNTCSSSLDDPKEFAESSNFLINFASSEFYVKSTCFPAWRVFCENRAFRSLCSSFLHLFGAWTSQRRFFQFFRNQQNFANGIVCILIFWSKCYVKVNVDILITIFFSVISLDQWTDFRSRSTRISCQDKTRRRIESSV